MKADKLKKMFLEVSRYRYIKINTLSDWNFRLSRYESFGDYRDIGEPVGINPGTRWGKTGDTGHFSRTVKVPEDFCGYKLYLELVTGGEAQVFLNGKAFQGNDPNHYRVLLADKAEGNEVYDIEVESYVRVSQDAIGEFNYDKACTGEFMQADLCAVHVSAEEFIRDIEFALNLAETHEEYLPAIEGVLSRIFTSFDILDQKSFLAYVEEGTGLLHETLSNLPYLESEYNVWMISQSHLDIAWFWRKAETYRKVVRTFSSALRNMEQKDFFRFMMPQVKLYKMLKEADNQLFEQVKQRVMEGKWEIAGLMYLEPDTNLVSGEYLVRQILFGRRFYKNEFEKVPDVESLIDAFGYSGNVPQILKKSGISSVMVTKMMWYQDTNSFPYSAFVWRGIDGSEVLAATMPWFNRPCTPDEIKANHVRNQQKDILKDVPVFYGWGDGGGGADENHLAGLERLLKWYKPSNVISGTMTDYFKKLSQYQSKLPAWWGEIYQEGHRGCYTSQALNKKYNRESEDLYRTLEFIAGFLLINGQKNFYPSLEENMELILVNQFHDILPGSAANKVYEDSHKEYEKILQEGGLILKNMLEVMGSMVDTSAEGVPVILWNLNGVSRPGLVKVKFDKPLGRLMDSKGNEIPYQAANGEIAFIAGDIPAFGYSAYYMRNQQPQAFENKEQVKQNQIENDKYTVSWNDKGHLVSIFDKVSSRELLVKEKGANLLTVYFDYPRNCDAWDIDGDYVEKQWVLEAQTIEAPKEDTVKQWVTLHYKFGKSEIKQDIILYKGLQRIEFATVVNWHEKHRLLKANFNFDILASKVTYDIPFGVLERACHVNNSYQKAQFEVPALSFADISEGNYGVALMSDCKHGFSAKDNQIGLSLLRSPVFPDPEADQGEHEFSYFIYGHDNGFREGEVILESRSIVNKVKGMVVENSSGILSAQGSLIKIAPANVIIEALKESEDKDGLVLRVFEAFGQRNRVKIELPVQIKAVDECNLVEEVLGKPEFDAGNLGFDIMPFEVKTFKLYFDKKF